MKSVIFNTGSRKALGPYSQAIKENGFIFVSGQVALDPATGAMVKGNIALETEQVLENVMTILTGGASSLSKVVKATIFLKDLNDLEVVNEVCERFFHSAPPVCS